MQLKDTVRQSWTLYRTHFREWMTMLLIEVALRLMVLTPLLFLCAPETRLLSLLCIPLFVLILLPARQNAAEAMQDLMDGDSCLSLRLISLENYWGKVLRGLRQGGWLLLWALPVLAATGFCLYIYTGTVDVFTVFRTLISLGGGSSIQGAKLVMLLYLATLLPFFVGCAFHSWNRHAAALDAGRELIAHRRVGLMLTQLFSLVTLIPFAAVAAIVSMSYLSGVAAALSNLANGGFTLPPLDEKIWLIAGAFVVLCLPLLPFKRLLPAVYVRGLTLDSESATSAQRAVL